MLALGLGEQRFESHCCTFYFILFLILLFYLERKTTIVLPARRSKRGNSYSNVSGWVACWLSVTLRYCIKTAKPIWKHFRPSESPIILLSRNPCRYTITRGTHSAGTLNTRGWENWRFSFDFRRSLHRRLSRKRCEIGRWLLWNVNSKSWVPDWMG